MLEREPLLLAAKAQALTNSIGRGNPDDDLKSPAGELYNSAKDILGLKSAGNTAHAFLRDTLAPLITCNMKVYSELKHDIFRE